MKYGKYRFLDKKLIEFKRTIKEMVSMKKLVILIILILTAISCSYMEGGERLIRERGRRCRYNYKGEVRHCEFIN